MFSSGNKYGGRNERSMSQEERISRMAVLLFTDMVDSVALERRIGTQAYSRLLMEHHQLFQQAMAAAGPGKIHFDSGDGFLSEFNTAAAAVNAALLFEMFIREHKWESVVPGVRIGVHQGQLAEIRPDPAAPGKVVGLPVSIASRVMGIAQAGQILMSRPVYEDARQFVREHPASGPDGPKPPPLKWKSHGSYLFKGADSAIEIFEVGASGFAPLTTPPDSEKCQRVTAVRKALPRLPVPRPAAGAALTALCGVALLFMPFGERWVDTSYDYLFRFSARSPTNKVALVFMDDPAYLALGQARDNWDRALHAQLLNNLAEGGCPMVVFDICFRTPRNKDTDAALAAAIRRHGHVALMSMPSNPSHPRLDIRQTIPPDKLFADAAAGNHGIGAVDNLGPTARRHWPFPAPGLEQIQSLPWVAARLAGGRLNDEPQDQWLRYYGEMGAWEPLSYHVALSNSPAFFKDKIVFIGNKPENSDPLKPASDKFSTPYTRWTGETVGGMEILATTFLNLMNGDWLRRMPQTIEFMIVVLAGVALGAGLSWFKPVTAIGLGLALAVAFSLAGVVLSYVTNIWFPWLILAGGQVPCAIAFALLPIQRSARPAASAAQVSGAKTIQRPRANENLPEAPEYELVDPPFGEGGFGRVWLARNAIGQWQALKAVYQAKFGDNPGPYEAEFNGLQKYKPVSEKHPGLLRIDLVSKKRDAGYFYYVMELGDSMEPGWEQNPMLYKPRDLESVRRRADQRRLPVQECLRIGIPLADALEFLHSQGLTHRDVKPSNIIFVNGRPKLADVGLVTNIRPADQIKTWVGTTGYMPPHPEHPGTAQADIYALGMVLYVLSTGRNPDLFPDLATTLLANSGHADFLKLNAVILKACQPDRTARYQTASEMHRALQTALT
jgi:CHASE2 domain-containing sensor protein/class 3 adenylate cyclase